MDGAVSFVGLPCLPLLEEAGKGKVNLLSEHFPSGLDASTTDLDFPSSPNISSLKNTIVMNENSKVSTRAQIPEE